MSLLPTAAEAAPHIYRWNGQMSGSKSAVSSVRTKSSVLPRAMSSQRASTSSVTRATPVRFSAAAGGLGVAAARPGVVDEQDVLACRVRGHGEVLGPKRACIVHVVRWPHCGLGQVAQEASGHLM